MRLGVLFLTIMRMNDSDVSPRHHPSDIAGYCLNSKIAGAVCSVKLSVVGQSEEARR